MYEFTIKGFRYYYTEDEFNDDLVLGLKELVENLDSNYKKSLSNTDIENLIVSENKETLIEVNSISDKTYLIKHKHLTKLIKYFDDINKVPEAPIKDYILRDNNKNIVNGRRQAKLVYVKLLKLNSFDEPLLDLVRKILKSKFFYINNNKELEQSNWSRFGIENNISFNIRNFIKEDDNFEIYKDVCPQNANLAYYIKPKKLKVGRPTDEVKNKKITVRLTESQYNKLNNNDNISESIQKLITKEITEDNPNKKAKEFINLFFNNLDEQETLLLEKIFEDKINLNNRINNLHKEYEQSYRALKNLVMNNQQGGVAICNN